MPRHYGHPFNGRRYLLDKGTITLHDLDNERLACHIGEIRRRLVEMFDTREDAFRRQEELFKVRNGCAHCMPEDFRFGDDFSASDAS